MPLFNPPAVSGGATGALNGFRLSLESGVPISTSDQTGKTTLYAVPLVGSTAQIDLWDGTKWVTYSSSQFSLALGTLTADKNYDIWSYVSGGAPALEVLAWTDNTTRATALAAQGNVAVKNGDATRRFMGTLRMVTTTQTEDSAAKRFLWNGPEPWRQVQARPLVSPAEAANFWTYDSTTVRQANANTANKVEVVVGLMTSVVASVVANGAYSSGSPEVGIGVDSITAYVSGQRNARVSYNSGQNAMVATYNGLLTDGYHYIAWLESAPGGTTANFNGDANATTLQSGLTAQVPG